MAAMTQLGMSALDMTLFVLVLRAKTAQWHD